MCLFNPKVIKPKRNKIRVYKSIIVHYTTGIHQDCITLVSSYKNNYTWKVGSNQSSRTSTDLTNDERDLNEVYYGFHVLDKQKDAVNECYWYAQEVWVALTAYKKDYVCSGDFHTKEDCSVYTKLTLEKREYERAIKRAIKKGIIPNKS